jgi:hypothetical protein
MSTTATPSLRFAVESYSARGWTVEDDNGGRGYATRAGAHFAREILEHGGLPRETLRVVIVRGK